MVYVLNRLLVLPQCTNIRERTQVSTPGVAQTITITDLVQ